jgi:hypothetical protein
LALVSKVLFSPVRSGLMLGNLRWALNFHFCPVSGFEDF